MLLIIAMVGIAVTFTAAVLQINND